MSMLNKTAAQLLALLKNQKPCIIGVSSSCTELDTLEAARGLCEGYIGLDMKACLVNGVVNSDIQCGKMKLDKKSEAYTEITLTNGEKLTPNTVNEGIEKIKAEFDIAVVALDVVSLSIPAMLLSANCDGIVLVEKKNNSRTDNIDKELAAIQNMGIKPLGFILI